ncbi:peptidoglycan bridge formation glycyltransferase FemA/FemB family protein [Arenibacter palladensis]|uniref:peptidoglycan bridge formation glycyltransferase FemA/FemB family protein n=1 Tax=Arenibacter palladensis TaxID=237373 RepID=UPI002FD6048B
MIEIISEKEKWHNVLEAADSFDVYHTYEYHHISKKPDEKPMLLTYSEEDRMIAIPLLLRKIPNSIYKDCTSVYGYGGPVTKNLSQNFDQANFASKIHDFLLINNIVSVFSRLNPFISNQPFCLQGMGEIISSSRIVNIDITQNLEEQKKDYGKRLRTHINKARRACYVRQAESKEEVLEYIKLYYENMTRVNAKKEYFFSEDYFFGLLDAKDFDTRILLSIEKETHKIIAGAMFIKTNNIVQYHLSGSDANYLHLYPIKLLIDEMRVRATLENCIFYNLGGGVGYKEDSLFDFKSAYSKDFKPFSLWRYIVNLEVYNKLIAEKEEKSCSPTLKKCSHFFPCYRCKQ